MPFTTVAEFRTAVKNWSKRTELSDAEIDDFTVLFESELFSEIRIRAMETVDAAFAVTGRLTALPSGFKELRSIQNIGSPSTSLKLISPQSAAEAWDYADSDTSVAYIIEGDYLRMEPAPSSMTLRLDYYKALDSITTTVPLNWVMTNHPNVYLFGVLRYYTPYIGEDERTQTWEAWYQRAKELMVGQDRRSKRKGSQPFMRVAVNP